MTTYVTFTCINSLVTADGLAVSNVGLLPDLYNDSLAAIMPLSGVKLHATVAALIHRHNKQRLYRIATNCNTQTEVYNVTSRSCRSSNNPLFVIIWADFPTNIMHACFWRRLGHYLWTIQVLIVPVAPTSVITVTSIRFTSLWESSSVQSSFPLLKTPSSQIFISDIHHSSTALR